MRQQSTASMEPARRERLMEVAAREFAAEGFQQASLNRIIRACRMSKSSFYYYVESKRQLFELVLENLVSALVKELAIPAPEEFATDFWAHTDRVLWRLAELAERRPLFTDLGRMFYLPGAPTGPHSAADKAVSAAEEWLDRVLTAGLAAGAVRDDLPLNLLRQVTFAVLRVFDEWTLRHQDDLDPGRLEQLVRAELDALRRLLAPDGDPRDTSQDSIEHGHEHGREGTS